MFALKKILENCPIVAGQHLFARHCKEGNPHFDVNTSRFVNEQGADIKVKDAMDMLNVQIRKAARLASSKPTATTRIDGFGPLSEHKLRLLKTKDPKNLVFAFTDGTLVGKDGDKQCHWMCFIIGKTPVGGRHQWVTAYPVTDRYIEKNLP
ncbi:MAG: hypothetical protein ACLFRU_08610 [Paracoccaceae bacterium]